MIMIGVVQTYWIRGPCCTVSLNNVVYAALVDEERVAEKRSFGKGSQDVGINLLLKWLWGSGNVPV